MAVCRMRLLFPRAGVLAATVSSTSTRDFSAGLDARFAADRHARSEHRLSFDLHQHVRIDQAADLEHGRRWAHLREELAVRAPDLFPIGYARDENPCTHHFFHSRACADERVRYVLKRLQGLLIWISDSNDFALRVGCCRSGNIDDVAGADGARIADDRFPLRAAGDIDAFHLSLLEKSVLQHRTVVALWQSERAGNIITPTPYVFCKCSFQMYLQTYFA